jgi:hypothetical protein
MGGKATATQSRLPLPSTVWPAGILTGAVLPAQF